MAAHVRLLLQSFRLSAWHSSDYRGRQVYATLPLHGRLFDSCSENLAMAVQSSSHDRSS